MSLAELRQVMGRRIAAPLVPAIARSGLTPNALTIIGLVINLVAATAIALGYFVAGGILVLVSGLFDLLDGALARFSKQTTTFGGVLDSTVDRLSEAAIFLALILFYLPRAMEAEVVLAFLALVGSFLISYIRARAEGLGLDCKVGFFTRAERVVLLVLGLLLGQVLIALAVLAVLTFETAIHRLVHVWRVTRK